MRIKLTAPVSSTKSNVETYVKSIFFSTTSTAPQYHLRMLLTAITTHLVLLCLFEILSWTLLVPCSNTTSPPTCCFRVASPFDYDTVLLPSSCHLAGPILHPFPHTTPHPSPIDHHTQLLCLLLYFLAIVSSTPQSPLDLPRLHHQHSSQLLCNISTRFTSHPTPLLLSFFHTPHCSNINQPLTLRQV